MKKPRACGTCNACCIAMPIREPELTKERYAPCPHLSDVKGCAIYRDRPPVCSGFQCEWLRGQLEGEHRPDRLGLIFQHIDNVMARRLIKVDLPPLSRTLAVYETRPGASNEGEAFRLLSKVSKNHPILLYRKEGFRVMGPDIEATRILQATFQHAAIDVAEDAHA